MRKYYKYQDTTWTRPNIYSDGTLGGGTFACSSSAYYGGYNPWKAFNGVTTDRSDGWESNSANPWFIFYNPNALKVKKIRIQNYTHNMGYYQTKSGDIYGSNDGENWTEQPIKHFTNTNFNASEWWEIDLSTNTNYYKYYKFTNLEYSNWCLWVEMEITATYRKVVPGTSSDYDFYKDEDVYFSPGKTVRKYYKYSYQNFIQPTLNNNATSNSSFLVRQGVTYGNHYAWHAFDNNTGTYCDDYGATTGNQWQMFYFSHDTRLTQLEYIGFASVGIAWSTAVVQYSDNGLSWTDVTTITKQRASGSNLWDISDYTNNQYHKYWRVFCRARSVVTQINITATQKIPQETTSSDYDFYMDLPVYYDNDTQIRRYYKYTSTTWTQPTLTSNGIMGVSSFATSASAVYSGREPYRVFNSDTSLIWETTVANPQWLSFYSEIPLKITNFGIQNLITNDGNAGGHILKTGYIQGSNTGNDDDWINLAPFSNSDTTHGKIWYVDLSSNTESYHYYRIYIETSNQYPIIQQLYLTGQQLTVVEGTASDYDFYEDINVQRVLKL